MTHRKQLFPIFVNGVEFLLDTVEQVTGQVNHCGERIVVDDVALSVTPSIAVAGKGEADGES